MTISQKTKIQEAALMVGIVVFVVIVTAIAVGVG